MHVTNQKLSFDINGRRFTKCVHGTCSLLNIPKDLWHKRKTYNFDPYNVLLAIATDIPVLLMTGFVL